jgi:hypothetical protein
VNGNPKAGTGSCLKDGEVSNQERGRTENPATSISSATLHASLCLGEAETATSIPFVSVGNTRSFCRVAGGSYLT